MSFFSFKTLIILAGIIIFGLIIKYLPWSALLEVFKEYGYPLLFLGTFLEGEIILLAGGFLTYLGHFKFFWIIIVACLAIILGDNVQYWIGYKWGENLFKKRNRFLYLKREHLEKLNGHFNDHGNKIILASRFLFGMRTAVILTAGIVRMNWWRFFKFNALSGIIWTGAIASVGYLFGGSFILIRKILQSSFISITVIVIIVFLIEIYFSRRIKRKMINEKRTKTNV